LSQQQIGARQPTSSKCNERECDARRINRHSYRILPVASRSLRGDYFFEITARNFSTRRKLMKISNNSLSAILAIGLAMAAIEASASSHASATLTATVETPVTISNQTGLNFGRFAAPLDGAVTVIVDAASGARSGTADLVGVLSDGAAAFSVARANSLAYTATITYNGTQDAVGTGLTLSDVTASCAGGSTIAIGASGGNISCAGSGTTDTLRVGGRLTIGTNAVTTTATGFVTATVAYN
jgi:hypothetical protein